MSSTRYLRLRIGLDIAQVDSIQDSRTFKLQKEEFINCKARSIECILRPIDTQILQIFKKA